MDQYLFIPARESSTTLVKVVLDGSAILSLTTLQQSGEGQNTLQLAVKYFIFLYFKEKL